jgi:queuosine precursor transporter
MSLISAVHHKSSRLFLILGGFFIANAIIAEFMGVKLFSLEATLGLHPIDLKFFGNDFSFNLTAGVLLWPVVFVMTDIINEYYGEKGVKFLSYMAVALLSYAFFMFYIGIKLTPASFWIGSKKSVGVPDMNAAYNQIFGQGLGIIIGSLSAFLVGQVVDVVIFHRIKKITGEKLIWLRSTGSTIVSQLVDSFVVLFIAFYIYPRWANYPPESQWSFGLVMTICIGNYIYKFIVAVLMTPVLYLIHNWVEHYLGAALATEMKQQAIKDE